MQLAERIPLEIVSMDSALVYRGLDIGTAKPPASLRTRVPHHLIDILEPTEAYSAGRFARDAGDLIAAIHARGHVPLLVGGTLLYLRALREGLATLPRIRRCATVSIARRHSTDGAHCMSDCDWWTPTRPRGSGRATGSAFNARWRFTS
jgi:tRNA dimethylallyltransferase